LEDKDKSVNVGTSSRYGDCVRGRKEDLREGRTLIKEKENRPGDKDICSVESGGGEGVSGSMNTRRKAVIEEGGEG